MRLGRRNIDSLWHPYRSSTYVSSISVIEKPERKSEEDEEPKDVKKVAFGFGRVLEES